MALTLRAEQRLAKAKLVELFDNNRATWLQAAQRTYNFVKGGFPPGSTIRPDDVAKALAPIMEVDESLRRTLDAAKLRQRYWVTDFTDLIIDRTWEELVNDDE